jgi:hypothetical protein
MRIRFPSFHLGLDNDGILPIIISLGAPVANVVQAARLIAGTGAGVACRAAGPAFPMVSGRVDVDILGPGTVRVWRPAPLQGPAGGGAHSAASTVRRDAAERRRHG